jgi:acetate kinase
MNLLVLNCGSATVKYKLFTEAGDKLSELAAGTIEVAGGYEAAVEEVLASLPHLPDAVAHRVVHGGDKYFEPALIHDEVLAQIEAMADFAPLHNPPALSGIRATEHLAKPQIAAFDTAFHQTMPPRAYQYALPRELTESLRLRRYGFHGQSHRYVSQECGHILSTDAPTLVSLHLGNGASCAAIKQGRCVDTSMGATPLEGLVMGSRGGDLDPAISILLQRKGMKLDEVEALLWHTWAGYLRARTRLRSRRSICSATEHANTWAHTWRLWVAPRQSSSPVVSARTRRRSDHGSFPAWSRSGSSWTRPETKRTRGVSRPIRRGSRCWSSLRTKS